ncbi:MAG: glycosyltransferase [Eubacteriales bacterium]|jgi:glycosyltransferase involved in cell wall biosynthesis
MKKILIITNHMNVGGIQKSLLELLKALSACPDYDVSLFCCKKTGAFLEQIPSNIKILPENKYAVATEQPLSVCKKLGKKYYFFRMVSSLWSKYFTKALPARVLCKLIGKIGGEYDVAISYSQPIEDHAFCNFTNEIVLNCTCGTRKITFVHCDFGAYGGNTKRNRELYTRFDYIAAVSESVGKRFAQILPELSERIRTVYNFCDTNEIEQLASQDPIEYKKTAIVTVARLSEEKGLLRCIPIFDRLKKNGHEFEWHIVGGGALKKDIEEETYRYRLQENIFLEGEQVNPYRHLKNADWLLLPSFHEAAPMVYDEAYTLGVPILTTKTLSAVEMIEERHIGLVCENDDEAIYDMICRALSMEEKNKIIGKPDNDICLKQFNSLCQV